MRVTVVAVAFLAVGVVCAAQDQKTAPQKEPTQQTSGNQVPPAAQRDVNGKQPQSQPTNKPLTGKTGEKGTALNDTTSGTAGVETPAYMTNTGVAQQPGNNTMFRTPPPNPQSRPGAPPNFEQAGQMQQHADANAAKAIEAEVGGAPGGGTLGINNVMPAYNTKGAGAQTRAAQEASPTGTAAGAQGQGAKRNAGKKPPAQQP